MARAIANSSSREAVVPGTGRPSSARWRGVREVEKPSAPARIASPTTRAMAVTSASVAGSLAAPRSSMT